MRMLNRCRKHGALVSLWTFQIRGFGGKPIPLIHCNSCTTDRFFKRLAGGPS